jgi:hypothetical protein
MHSDGLLLSRVIGGPVSCRGAIAKALTTLLHAADFAQFSGRSLWDFAVELSELHRLSLDTAAIRWLVLEGLVEMAIEKPVGLSDSEVVQTLPRRRTYRPTHTMVEVDGLCFVLTDIGIRLARELTSVLPEYSRDVVSLGTPGEKSNLEAAPKPTWIAAVRELRAGQTLVKRFRLKAPAQESVLAAFEEDGWPQRIDDPLAPQPFSESKRRLRSTIQSLNRFQEEPMIRFRADGTGEGIVWEWHGPVKAKSLIEKVPEPESLVTTNTLQSFVAATQPWECV